MYATVEVNSTLVCICFSAKSRWCYSKYTKLSVLLLEKPEQSMFLKLSLVKRVPHYHISEWDLLQQKICTKLPACLAFPAHRIYLINLQFQLKFLSTCAIQIKCLWKEVHQKLDCVCWKKSLMTLRRLKSVLSWLTLSGNHLTLDSSRLSIKSFVLTSLPSLCDGGCVRRIIITHMRVTLFAKREKAL